MERTIPALGRLKATPRTAAALLRALEVPIARRTPPIRPRAAIAPRGPVQVVRVPQPMQATATLTHHRKETQITTIAAMRRNRALIRRPLRPTVLIPRRAVLIPPPAAPTLLPAERTLLLAAAMAEEVVVAECHAVAVEAVAERHVAAVLHMAVAVAAGVVAIPIVRISVFSKRPVSSNEAGLFFVFHQGIGATAQLSFRSRVK